MSNLSLKNEKNREKKKGGATMALFKRRGLHYRNDCLVIFSLAGWFLYPSISSFQVWLGHCWDSHAVYFPSLKGHAIKICRVESFKVFNDDCFKIENLKFLGGQCSDQSGQVQFFTDTGRRGPGRAHFFYQDGRLSDLKLQSIKVSMIVAKTFNCLF